VAVPAAVVIKTLYQKLYLARRVRDPAELEARSERALADEGTDEAEADMQSAPESSSRRRSRPLDRAGAARHSPTMPPCVYRTRPFG